MAGGGASGSGSCRPALSDRFHLGKHRRPLHHRSRGGGGHGFDAAAIAGWIAPLRSNRRAAGVAGDTCIAAQGPRTSPAGHGPVGRPYHFDIRGVYATFRRLTFSELFDTGVCSLVAPWPVSSASRRFHSVSELASHSRLRLLILLRMARTGAAMCSLPEYLIRRTIFTRPEASLPRRRPAFLKAIIS
jgi:hypothetical protein